MTGSTTPLLGTVTRYPFTPLSVEALAQEEISLRDDLAQAVERLLVHEATLFTSWASGRSASERSVCAQLAWRLRSRVPRGWDVDVEYNRAGVDAIKGGAVFGPQQGDGGWRQHPADLVVHRRTLTGPANNLLVVELKAGTRSAGSGGSLASLYSLMVAHEYRHGVYLDLGVVREGSRVLAEPMWSWLSSDRSSEQPVFPGSGPLQIG